MKNAKGKACRQQEAADANGTRKRLRRDERERMIVDEAIRFFSEVGFGGQTRELARRLNVTQPLLFQYFPTKDDLIERVYQDVYVGRWKNEWEAMLTDRSRDLESRLITFYTDYLKTILAPEWVRIFMYSGLENGRFNRRYLSLVRDHILRQICVELRAERGLPSPEELAIGEREIELAWRLHGGFFYIGVRRWIYGTEAPTDLEPIIHDGVAQFLAGSRSTIDTIVEDAARHTVAADVDEPAMLSPSKGN